MLHILEFIYTTMPQNSVVKLPCMRDANDVVDIREGELEELVHDNTAGIRESKERMIREAGFETHGARVDDGLVAHRGEGLVSMNDRYPLPQDNCPEDRKESVECRRGSVLKDNLHGDMVNFEPVGQTPNPAPAAIGVCDDNNFVSPLYQALRDMVEM